ncbi:MULTISPECIES: Coenzyme F420 hydrogenase/dehydrogenase, beta subunit C-terminal domain [unclassified Dietzia]|uniref:Coenzyme F420 hydrogenase/dehydrogenase, beta subunit C-terminal domain n=1 Tax=unclassified Dietzia TaxID=2617939 RepID=UPI0015FA9890|nr:MULTISPECIES: Coenzyme F420 hydrogenase/dehydrogenase, beta subunit C-terminal domain [unclassified Dietzia]MBB1039785.1 coenzyme F420 hydrogenase [Dietzia sp. Cai40]MBB1043935.1 coenzyme F420 hydrogenase [Dietzia sp. DQ11-44]
MSKNHTFGIREVLENNCCIGCGGCVYAGEDTSIDLNRDGLYVAKLGSDSSDLLDQVCPFSDGSTNEDELGTILYGKLPHKSSAIGRYSSLYAGRVSSDEVRVGSSSGGLVSWIASKLLTQGTVNGIIHVKSSDGPEGPLFQFGLSHSVEDLLRNRKSIYYPVEFSKALKSARQQGGKYAFIGIPCHIKAIRQLQMVDDWAKDCIPVTIGLVCGHMKSTGFAESLAWQVDVEPQNLLSVDFRVKDPMAPANRYKFSATAASDRQTHERANFEMIGSNWGHAFFQPNACNYCDDVFAELADISLGDAWLPRFQSDPLGHNVVVVRAEHLDSILREGVVDAEVVLEELDEEEVFETQAGNIRHRRIGLSVRTADDDAMRIKHPSKRVPPTYATADAKRIDLVRLRRRSSFESFDAFNEAKKRSDFNVFRKRMAPIIRKYDAVSATARSEKVLARMPIHSQKYLRRLLNRIR